jgi:hypothetical protein
MVENKLIRAGKKIDKTGDSRSEIGGCIMKVYDTMSIADDMCAACSAERNKIQTYPF